MQSTEHDRQRRALYELLAIAPHEALTYWRLLGVSEGEENTAVIEGAADRQLALLDRRSADSPYRDIAPALLNDIHAARATLLNAQSRQAYQHYLTEQRAAWSRQQQALGASPAPPRIAVATPPRLQAAMIPPTAIPPGVVSADKLPAVEAIAAPRSLAVRVFDKLKYQFLAATVAFVAVGLAAVVFLAFQRPGDHGSPVAVAPESSTPPATVDDGLTPDAAPAEVIPPAKTPDRPNAAPPEKTATPQPPKSKTSEKPPAAKPADPEETVATPAAPRRDPLTPLPRQWNLPPLSAGTAPAAIGEVTLDKADEVSAYLLGPGVASTQQPPFDIAAVKRVDGHPRQWRFTLPLEEGSADKLTLAMLQIVDEKTLQFAWTDDGLVDFNANLLRNCLLQLKVNAGKLQSFGLRDSMPLPPIPFSLDRSKPRIEFPAIEAMPPVERLEIEVLGIESIEINRGGRISYKPARQAVMTGKDAVPIQILFGAEPEKEKFLMFELKSQLKPKFLIELEGFAQIPGLHKEWRPLGSFKVREAKKTAETALATRSQQVKKIEAEMSAAKVGFDKLPKAQQESLSRMKEEVNQLQGAPERLDALQTYLQEFGDLKDPNKTGSYGPGRANLHYRLLYNAGPAKDMQIELGSTKSVGPAAATPPTATAATSPLEPGQ